MYNKIFSKILDSSVWLEPTPTRIVWFTFLAAMDETGFAQFASAANVAHRARVELPEAEAALACLEAPDPDSSDPEFEGRRVQRVPGGWMILNAEKYRDLVTRGGVREQTRKRVRSYRDRLKSQTLKEKSRNTHKKRSVTLDALHERTEALHVTGVTSSDTDTDTDTKKISNTINKQVPTAVADTTSTAVAAAAPNGNGNGHGRKRRPQFENERFAVHHWQVQELISMLGQAANGFDLDEWLMTGCVACAKLETAVVPDWWKWLKVETVREAGRRGLPLASPELPEAPHRSKHTRHFDEILKKMKG